MHTYKSHGPVRLGTSPRAAWKCAARRFWHAGGRFLVYGFGAVVAGVLATQTMLPRTVEGVEIPNGARVVGVHHREGGCTQVDVRSRNQAWNQSISVCGRK